MFKKILFCFFLFIISLSLYANEKSKIIIPEGKLKFRSLLEVSDEKENTFNLYENKFLSKLSPSFLRMFTKSDKNVLLFVNYALYTQMTYSMINTGITSSLCSLELGADIIIFSVLYYNLTSIIIFSVFSGVFLIGAFVLFPIAAYFYNKAKVTLMQMIDEYNANLNQGASLNDHFEINLFSFSLGKK